jgi:hypothetical protein
MMYYHDDAIYQSVSVVTSAYEYSVGLLSLIVAVSVLINDCYKAYEIFNRVTVRQVLVNC